MHIEERIAYLRDTIEYHRRKYYQDDSPEISDFEFDRLYRELEDLEKQYPQFDDPNSPTHRVGGTVAKRFEKYQHNYSNYKQYCGYKSVGITITKRVSFLVNNWC